VDLTARPVLNVLVIGDDLALRDRIRRTLHMRGMVVIEASSAASALRFAETTSPDAVVIDDQSQQADGLLANMRALLPAAHIVVLTSDPPTDRSVSLAAANVFVPRTVSGPELAAVLQDA
jgi:DNA-binding response OmpR family regulator